MKRIAPLLFGLLLSLSVGVIAQQTIGTSQIRDGAVTPIKLNAASGGSPVAGTFYQGDASWGVPSISSTPGSLSQPISGCGVAFNGGNNFTMATCTYTINGVQYTSPQTDITLAASDPTNDRIDIFAVTTSSTAIAITGTPGSPAVPPDVDYSTQLAITQVTIAAASSSASVTTVDIYHENVEWTCVATAHVNCASTNNPHTGTLDVEYTAAVNTNRAQFTNGSTINLANSDQLVSYVRSKATFPSNCTLGYQWFNNNAAKGPVVSIKAPALAFNSATTGSYQNIVMPTSMFGINGTPVNRLRVSVVCTGAGSIGLYLDDITLQKGVQNVPSAGNVFGPGSSVAGNVVEFTDTSGKNIGDAGYQANTVVLNTTGPVVNNDVALFSGTTGQLIKDSGAVLPVGANPSASVGPAAVNGSAATFMRSDAAPPLANTAVTAGSYGDATHVGAFTVDAQGRLTAASSTAITAGTVTGTGTANNIAAWSSSSAIKDPNASLSANSQKITNLTNGSASSDAAAFGQIPTNVAQTNAANVFTKQQAITPCRGTIAGAVTIDLTSCASGSGFTFTSGTPSNNVYLTATANVSSLAFTNQVDGAVYTIWLLEDGTGGWTFPSVVLTGCKYPGGTAPTPTTTANARNLLSAQRGSTEAIYMCSFLAGMN